MRWDKKEKKVPRDGERKTYNKFVWWPTLYHNKWVWLESVTIEKTYMGAHKSGKYSYDGCWYTSGVYLQN